MLLYCHLQRQVGPIRGNARYIARLARRVERLCANPGIVIGFEDDLSPSERSVLEAISEHQERELRELLEPTP